MAVTGAVAVMDALKEWTVDQLIGQTIYLRDLEVEHDAEGKAERVRFTVIDAEGEDIGASETARMYLVRKLARMATNVPPGTLIGPGRFVPYKKTITFEGL